MNKYYYVPQTLANATQIADIQAATGANIVNVVPIKMSISPVKDQQGNDIVFYEGYYEIEWDFSEQYHNELLAIQGTQYFDNAEGAREFKQNGFLPPNNS